MVEKEEMPEDWAIERALAEMGSASTYAYSAEVVRYAGEPFRNQSALKVIAFARYIAKHEKPQADPLLIEARRIVADWREPSGDSVNVRIGNHDNRGDVQQALAALRRGMELAREPQP